MALKVFSFLFVLLFFDNCFGIDIKNNSTNIFKILRIQDGLIRGTKERTVGKGTPYYRFRGIPYAKPPVNNLRFEIPTKNEKWRGTWDATKDASECVQGETTVTGSEDCLYINVYTPNTKGNLSVMVWIYGGTFITGNSSYEMFAPDFLLDHNVIFVSFNYRLGIFGFLSTEDLIIPGNIGLKDQHFALNWVKNNIKYFGGDPKKVTIFGESAGAVSVSYLVQSKRSAGLFRSAIMESGNSLCLWALNRRAKETAFAIGKSLKIDTSNSTTLLEGLRKVDYDKLQTFSLTTATLFSLKNPLAGLPFSPVEEPCYEGAIFCGRSDELLKNGQYNRVPVIIGLNSNEANVIDGFPIALRLYTVRYDLDQAALAPADLTNDTLKKIAAGIAIKLHYFGILMIAVQADDAVKFVSDDQFNRPTRRTVLNMSKYSPVYFYIFSHEGAFGQLPNNSNGVGHTGELGYLFYRRGINGTNADKIVSNKLVTMWTNFAKYGDPTPKSHSILNNVRWTPTRSDPKNLSYINISLNLQNGINPFEQEMEFYDNVYRIQGSGSYDTY